MCNFAQNSKQNAMEQLGISQENDGYHPNKTQATNRWVM